MDLLVVISMASQTVADVRTAVSSSSAVAISARSPSDSKEAL